MQDPAVFRTDVALVRLDIEVTDPGGPVRGLRPEDFRIFDNRRLQKPSNFAYDEGALDIVLPFDSSYSMGPVVARVAKAAHIALSELREGDRTAVMAFASKTDLIADFTGDSAAVEKTVSEQMVNLGFRCCTHIQGALADAAKQFTGLPARPARRAIVIVTDDDGTSPQPDALRELWNANAAVVGVVVAPPGTTGPVHATHFEYFGMRDIAVRTGGDSVDTTDPAEGLSKVLHRLRSRYSAFYALPAARSGEERSVQVQLTPAAQSRYPRAIVRARTGYIVP